MSQKQRSIRRPSKKARADTLKELRDAVAALSRPEVVAEVFRQLEEATEEAAREHERILIRSMELAGIPMFPGSGMYG